MQHPPAPHCYPNTEKHHVAETAVARLVTYIYIDTATTTDPTQTIELSPATEAEQDMLDLAYKPNGRSRLACQVRLLTVPSTTGSPATPIIKYRNNTI